MNSPGQRFAIDQDRVTQPLQWTSHRAVFGLIAILAIGGCAGLGPRLKPPQLGIVELERIADRQFNLSIRIRNTSPREMPVSSLTFTFTLDDAVVAHLTPEVNLTVPPLGNEVIPVSTQVSPAIAARLTALENGSVNRLSYRLDGTVYYSRGRLPIDESGWLSRTPGKPGFFR